MSPTNETSLGGFEQRLLGELREFVERRAAAQAPHQDLPSPSAAGRHRSSRSWRHATTPRRWAAALTAAALIACVVAFIDLTSESAPSLAQAFPVLNSPAISVPELVGLLRDGGATLENARVDVHDARAITTPWGTGYVLTDKDANRICLAVPGLGHAWWAGCGTATMAKRQGVDIELSFDKAEAAEYVAVLPKGATATIQLQDGKTKVSPLREGVLAIVIHHPTIITTIVAGRTTQTTLTPPSKSPTTGAGVSAPTPPSAAPRAGGGAGAP